MQHAIKVTALTKEFRTGTGRPRLFGRREQSSFLALDHLNLTVDAGERIAYIGPNGAGKSTSIKIFTGILHPTSGEAEVLGLVPWRARRELAYRIGTIFGQRSQLIGDLPAGATFDLHAQIYGLERAEYRRNRDELLDLFDAADLVKQPVRTMSLGQRMRCELVTSLLHRPDIIFMDEPTIGLDLIAKRTLRDLILRLNEQRGITVMLTSHDVADLETVARRVVIVDHGRAIFDGSVDALRSDFLREKLVEVQFVEPEPPPFEVAGCELLASDEYSLSLRVDLRERRLGDVLNELVTHRRVEDMTIGDPPLEDVIGHIYVQGAD